MHRLVIVSGPNRGSSFNLIEGENSIGRQMDNHIMLSSGKVSKRHCAILLGERDIFLRDEGSTNGTFVNGTLIRKAALKNGDKIGVGEFVLELVSPRINQQLSVKSSQNPVNYSYAQPVEVSHGGSVSSYDSFEQNSAPQELPDKIKYGFETKVMPFFYGNLMNKEFRSIFSVLLVLFTMVAVVGSVAPVTDLAQKTIQRESKKRAKILAKELKDRFTPAISSHAESQINLDFLEGEDSVKMVAILDPNMQIIAPQSRVNQILGGGPEAAVAIKALKKFKDGQEKGYSEVVGENIAVHVEPVQAIDVRSMRTSFAAMVVVSVDFSENVMTSGDLGVQYGTGFLLTGLAALFLYFVMMRLLLKPLEVLNDDLDKILRGELPKVTHEFKFEELNSLWNNINSTVQRISKGSQQDSSEEFVNWDQAFAPVKALSDSGGMGYIAFDPALTVVGMNSQFEEISGIRMDAIGQSLQQIARDQSMVSLTKDMQEKVMGSMTSAATDEFEFSGVAYHVVGTMAGPVGKAGFAMTFRKKD